MLHIKTLYEGLDIFKALGSDIRIKIIETLLENNGMNMNELASALNISNSALTGHIKKLEDCRLVAISSEPSRHGNQKYVRYIWIRSNRSEFGRQNKRHL